MVKKIIFISGNQDKVERVKEYLDLDVEHRSLDLEEIQSLDLQKIVEDKARRAYEQVQSPVLVEDVSLVYHALGGLPGPLIKWFYKSLGNAGLCRIINHYNKDRSATAEVCYGYFDGKQFKSFSAKVEGCIAASPRGELGFGWDAVFIPEGSDKTLGEVGSEVKENEFRALALKQLSQYLESID